jgi:hypothetical protein
MARQDQAVSEILRELPKLERTPDLRNDELLATAHVVRALPKLSFPIPDASELGRQVGDSIEVLGVKVNGKQLAHRLPRQAFPIASLPDFMETVASSLRKNPRLVRLGKEVDALGRQVPALKFPISSPAQLLEQVGGSEYTFKGSRVDPKEAVQQIPKPFFPIRSRLDLKMKMGALAFRGAR